MKTISISVIVILILLSTATISFAMPDHQKIACANCHQSLIENEEMCDTCHNIKDNKVQLEQRHSNICSNCHNVQNADSYHQMHNNVTCEKCHINGERPSVAINNCAGCHGESFAGTGNIHEIHKSKLDTICSKCHGAPPQSNPLVVGITSLSGGQKSQTLTQRVYARTIDYKKYTLYEIMKKLFASF